MKCTPVAWATAKFLETGPVSQYSGAMKSVLEPGIFMPT
jgi:hypothetical protein